LVEIGQWEDHHPKGDKRKSNPDYVRIETLLSSARRREDLDEIKRLKREMRKTISHAPHEPDYRRLRYIRYADDCAPRRYEELGSGPDSECHAA
jgi:hypothetical protein